MSKHLPDMYYAESDEEVDSDMWLRGKVFKTPLSAVRYIQAHGRDAKRYVIQPIEIIFYPSNVETDFKVT